MNKACPKDYFLLSKIDMLADATANHEMLSFLDAISYYNQIKMNSDDEEKNNFMTEPGTYCTKTFRLD